MRLRGIATGLALELERLTQLYTRLRARVERQLLALDLDAYRILARSGQPRSAPERTPIPEVDLIPLDVAIASVRDPAGAFDSLHDSLPAPTDLHQIARINHAMMDVERAFLRPGGLPGRPHYRNEPYSPGRLWDTVPFPAVGDAMLDGSWSRAQSEVYEAASTLSSVADAILRAKRQLQTVGQP